MPVEVERLRSAAFLWIKRSSRCWNVSEKIEFSSMWKVGYDVSEPNVDAELSPGTDFDPKQFESLKRRCDRRIQHTHIYTYKHTHIYTYFHTQRHECIPAHNKRRDALLELKTAQKPVCQRHPSLSLQRHAGTQIFSTLLSLFQRRKSDTHATLMKVGFILFRSHKSIITSTAFFFCCFFFLDPNSSQ